MTNTLGPAATTVSFIVTRDREKARGFYGGILGFKQTHEDNFALVYDMNGRSLRISTLKDFEPQQHTVLGWGVPDIAATVKVLMAKGVSFNRYPGLEHDELGIWTAPGSTAKIAWFLDPDGNNLSLTQF